MIPLHEELARCGFLAFVDQMRRAGHERLFPELQVDRRGYYSDRYQKWFGRHLDKSGEDAEDQLPFLPPLLHRRAPADRRHR
jgi:hypothetical protein